MNLDTLNIGAININKMQTLSALVQLAEQHADVPKELWQTVRIDEPASVTFWGSTTLIGVRGLKTPVETSRVMQPKQAAARLVGMAAEGFAEAVQAFLRLNVVPARRPEPRLAEALVSVDRQLIPSPQGVVTAWRIGEGPAVLLVHGWEDDNSLWAPLIDVLVARERSLVVFDLPAHGFSEGEWGLGPQGADGALAVSAALGPVDAVVTHSFGAAPALIAMSEGLTVGRAVMIAPPFGRGNRWLRYAERFGVADDVAFAAESLYEQRIGPARATFDSTAALVALDIELLVIHSTDDERNPLNGSRDLVPLCRHAELLVVEGLSHRRTARDPTVVDRVADFVSDPQGSATR